MAFNHPMPQLHKKTFVDEQKSSNRTVEKKKRGKKEQFSSWETYIIPEQKCKDVPKQKCQTDYGKKCQTQYRQEYNTNYSEQCTTKDEKECKTEYKKLGVMIPGTRL